MLTVTLQVYFSCCTLSCGRVDVSSYISGRKGRGQRERAIQYLKKAAKQPTSGEAETRRIVGEILDNIREGGEQRVRRYAAELDKWQGDIVVSPEAIAAASGKVPARLKQDIDFALPRLRDFAQDRKRVV